MQYPSLSRRTITGLLALFFISILVLYGCARAPIVKKTKPLMGTLVSIKLYDEFGGREDLKELIDKAFFRIEEIEKLTSVFEPESEVSRINTLEANQTIKVSYETLQVVNKSIDIWRVTDGAFDITVYPLLKLWRGLDGGSGVPPPEEITRVLGLVGSEKIIVDKEYGHIGFLTEGVMMDLSGIAKGFSVDEAINTLRREGIRNALIDAGGDIYCLGNAPDGRPWKIGVGHPRKDSVLTTLELKDIAVATSGDYENFIERGSDRFTHIINPRTGYPVEGGPVSVTVLAPDLATADGLATALSVLDPGEGLFFVDTLKGVEAIIISEVDGKIKIGISSGLEGLYEIKE